MPPGSLLRLSVSNEPLCRKSGSQVTWSPPPWVVINWWSRRSWSRWSRWSRRRNHEDLSLVCHQQPGHNCTRGRRKRSFLILTSPRKLSPLPNTNIILNIARSTTDAEIDSVTWIIFINNMVPLALVAYLATRLRHLH